MTFLPGGISEMNLSPESRRYRPSEAAAMTDENILYMKSVEKSFPGVKALDGVDFSCLEAEVHALIGHNGAGKSTLIKILGGVYEADRGEIFLHGKPFRPDTPLRAALAGISIIHQEFNLIPDLTVAQNIYLGREPRTRWKLLDRKKMQSGAAEALARLKVSDISPTDYVRELSVNQLQLVEIAKALSVKADIIVMDEPTAALPLPDVHKLFDTIAELKSSGVTIIYISHRLEEIFNICDRATLMRDGRMLATLPLREVDRHILVEKMCGRAISDFFPTHPQPGRNTAADLVVENFQSQQMAHALDFSVYKGEIYGITGLEGCGATALARALFGVSRKVAGQIKLNGETLHINSPRDALQAGFGFVTKDRRKEGLIITAGMDENLAIPLRVKEGHNGLLPLSAEKKSVERVCEKLNIRSAQISTEVQYLSGGNQQKVVLAKWLMTHCRLLIVDEPTRGVDVESKAEIYKLLRELADQGMIIIIVSSDMEEVLGLCDRLLVLHRGQITGLMTWNHATEEAVVLAATGCTVDAEGRPLDQERVVCGV
jgi:ribose transport system ATP-binding protein